MKFSSQPFVLAMAATLVFSSVVHAEGDKSKDSMSQQAGQQEGMKKEEMKQVELRDEEVGFKKGSAELTKDSKSKLSKLVQDAQKEGQIDHLTVVSWADTAYPPKGMQSQQSMEQQSGSENKMDTESSMPQAGTQTTSPTVMVSKADIDLAQKRADAISSYLKDELNVSNVKTIVMGKDHAEWFANAFNAGEAELQSQFARQGETPVSQPEFKIIKDGAKESVGLVIVTPVSAVQQSGSDTMSTPHESGGDTGTEESSGY